MSRRPALPRSRRGVVVCGGRTEGTRQALRGGGVGGVGGRGVLVKGSPEIGVDVSGVVWGRGHRVSDSVSVGYRDG